MVHQGLPYLLDWHSDCRVALFEDEELLPPIRYMNMFDFVVHNALSVGVVVLTEARGFSLLVYLGVEDCCPVHGWRMLCQDAFPGSLIHRFGIYTEVILEAPRMLDDEHSSSDPEWRVRGVSYLVEELVVMVLNENSLQRLNPFRVIPNS